MTARLVRDAYCVILALLISGCSSLAPLLSTPTPAPVKQATVVPEPTPTQIAPPPSEARILRVWLPPRFDPNAGTPSADLLKQRLIDFESRHPGLKIDIRIKAEEGDQGLLNALSLTSNAAPSALPDLVALPRPALETAALTGLLHPIDGLSTALDDPDWYAYARDLGRIQNIGYGLPFAGDVLILAHRAEIEGGTTWENIFTAASSLSFPAADPQGLFALSLYVSAGGEMLDSGGMPHLDQDALLKVLTWVRDGVSANVIFPSVKNVSTHADALTAYRSGRADMAVAWATDLPPGLVSPVPGLGDSGHSFATGWLWSLAGSNPENQQIAIELAEYLTAGDFIGEWTRSAGYLPTRPSSAVAGDEAVIAVAGSAYSVPSNAVLQVLGPLMQEALVRVLNGEQPEVAAGSVIEKLK